MNQGIGWWITWEHDISTPLPPHPRKKKVFTMRAFFHGDCKFKWICGNLTKAIATESTSTINSALVWDYFPILTELIMQTRQQGKESNDVAIKKINDCSEAQRKSGSAPNFSHKFCFSPWNVNVVCLLRDGSAWSSSATFAEFFLDMINAFYPFHMTTRII